VVVVGTVAKLSNKGVTLVLPDLDSPNLTKAEKDVFSKHEIMNLGISLDLPASYPQIFISS